MPTKEPGAIDSLVYDLQMDIPLPWLPQTSAAEEWLQTQTLLTKTARVKGGWILSTLPQKSPGLLQNPAGEGPKWSPLSPTQYREATGPSHRAQAESGACVHS